MRGNKSHVARKASVKTEGERLTDESLLAEGVLLAATVPWDTLLRGGGVRVAVLPDKDVVPLPDMLPNEGDPEKAQIT